MDRKTTLIATITAPVTASEARLRLRIDRIDPETDAMVDGELTALIESASEVCAVQLGRAVAFARYKLELPEGFPLRHPPRSHGGFFHHNAIALSWPDVKEVESVAYVDENGTEKSFADYRLSLSEFVRPIANDWPRGTDVVVTYTAGWGDKTPESVRHWILLQVGHWYKNREAATEKILMKVPFGDRLLSPYRIVKV
jgi:hypothetical protein